MVNNQNSLISIKHIELYQIPLFQRNRNAIFSLFLKTRLEIKFTNRRTHTLLCVVPNSMRLMEVIHHCGYVPRQDASKQRLVHNFFRYHTALSLAKAQPFRDKPTSQPEPLLHLIRNFFLSTISLSIIPIEQYAERISETTSWYHKLIGPVSFSLLLPSRCVRRVLYIKPGCYYGCGEQLMKLCVVKLRHHQPTTLKNSLYV